MRAAIAFVVAAGCGGSLGAWTVSAPDVTPPAPPQEAIATPSPDVGDETPRPPADRPYVLVLGTAQDAGLPQIGSRSAPSEQARRDPSRVRLATSLLIADPRSGHRWLVDATPDIRAQVERMAGHPPTRTMEGPRPPLFEAILLTHAHMGHYTGLLHLGREGYAARDALVRCSPRMCDLLRSDAPWRLLVELDYVELLPFAGDEPIALGEGLSATPIPVPHRAELTDTYGFVVRGPERALLFIPDIDKWERWERRIEELIAEVDIALLDGTFHAEDEMPGRSMADIPHPFIVESLARFASLPAEERAKIVFIHLNHTNAAADPDSEAAERIRDAGMRVAREAEIHLL